MLNFGFIILRSPVENINNVFNLPEILPANFKSGLYLASNDFYRQLEKFDYLTEDEKAKMESSLLKYWVRGSIRCTPFGTFAGSAVIYLAEKAGEIVLNEATFHARKNRLDMEFVQFLIKELEKLSVIQDQIKLLTNNSIYETPLNFRYTETVTINYQKDYKLTSVEKSEYLTFVFEKAANGITIQKLADELSFFAEVAFDESKQFVMEMWNSNLLVSNLEPCVTGLEPFENLLLTIKDYSGIDSLKRYLTNIFDRLSNPDCSANYYADTETLIKQLFPPPRNLKSFIQTDLFLSCEKKEITHSVIKSITEQVDDLLSFARAGLTFDLDAFRKTFIEKYESKIVPLSIALDADIGIGYAGVFDDISGGNSLIDDISYANIKLSQNISDDMQNYALDKYLNYKNDEKGYIEITENEIKKFKAGKKKTYLANSMHIHGALFKKDGELENDNFLFNLTAVGGSSGCNLLGRFTHGDQELFNQTKKAIDIEEHENQDIIFAEIVHLPQARVGNVLLRPLLRNYEIPYVGKSGAPVNQQLLITDLHVCIRDNEVILISKRLNKRIIPRLTTAHNFQVKSLPIYKFLCDLQYQNLLTGSVWEWGRLGELNHLPRVIYKNIIVKRARWKVEFSEVSKLPNSKDDYKAFFTNFNGERKIPQKVLLVESDNQILIDFDQQDSTLMFLNYLKKNKVVFIEEFLFTNENCIVKDKQGQSHTNEIIIPVYKTGDGAQKLKLYHFAETTVDEKYHPGSEWLFFKIFCSPNTGEKILINYLLPFIETGLKETLFTKFFFIRYKENGNHLRIRFYNQDFKKQNDILIRFSQFLKPMLVNGLINSITVDTYIPEKERYGGHDLLLAAENLFNADSYATLKMLNLLEPGSENNHRILIAMRNVDILLNDFGLLIDYKRELLKKIASNYLTEFGGNQALQKNINIKYKNLHKTIFSFMNPDHDLVNDMTDIIEIIDARTLQTREIVSQILILIAQKKDKAILEKLLMSYIHMMLNRIFISHQRKYELIIYHFLERYYTSLISIASRQLRKSVNIE